VRVTSRRERLARVERQREVRDDDLRDEDFFDDDLRAVARPPFAPAFFFCAVVPPRLEDDLRDEDEEDDAFDDDVDEDFVSPACARCLLTVRAAISFARFVERPLFFSDSLTCSYCRSRFLLHD
jgi:hypothetical protein